jgi:hypothetical protein
MTPLKQLLFNLLWIARACNLERCREQLVAHAINETNCYCLWCNRDQTVKVQDLSWLVGLQKYIAFIFFLIPGILKDVLRRLSDVVDDE